MSQLDYFSESADTPRPRRGIKLWGLAVLFYGVLQIFGYASLLTFLSRKGFVSPWISVGISSRYHQSPLVGVLLIGLGLGLFNTRRWARSFAIAYSIADIYGGVLNIASMMGTAVFIGSPGAITIRINGPFLEFVTLDSIVFPALLLWYFSRLEIAGDFDRANPNPTWTDRCPIPVLILCVALALPAFDLFLRQFRNVSPYPSIPAVAIYNDAHTALLLIASLLCFRINRCGWLFALGISLFDCGMNVRYFARSNIWLIVKPLPGHAAPILATLLICTCLSTLVLLNVAMFVYTLWIGRYFKPNSLVTI